MRFRTFGTALLVCALAAGCRLMPEISLPEVAFDEDASEWMAVMMNGQKVGYAVHSRVVKGDRVITREKVHFELKRGLFSIRLTTDERALETSDGRPLAFYASRTGAGEPVVVRGHVLRNGRMVLHTINAGQMREQELPWPKGAVMAEGARLFEARQPLTPGTTYDVTLFSPSSMRAIRATARVTGKKDVMIFGRKHRLTEVVQTMDMLFGGLKAIAYVDDNRNVRKAVVPIMGVQVEMVVCPKPVALSPNAPMDFLAMSLLTAPRGLTQAERDGPLTYTLAFDRGGAWDGGGLGASDEQTVKDYGDPVRSQRITVRPRAMPKGIPLRYAGRDRAAREALKPNRWIESDAPEIVALGIVALPDVASPLKAKVIRG